LNLFESALKETQKRSKSRKDQHNTNTHPVHSCFGKTAYKKRKRKKSGTKGKRTQIDWSRTKIECPRGDDAAKWIKTYPVKGRNKEEIPPIMCANLPGMRFQFNTMKGEITSVNKEGTKRIQTKMKPSQELLQEGVEFAGKLKKFGGKILKKVSGLCSGQGNTQVMNLPCTIGPVENQCQAKDYLKGALKMLIQGSKGSLDERISPTFVKMNTWKPATFPSPGSCRCWVTTSFGRTTCSKSAKAAYVCKKKLQIAYATIKVCKTHSDNGTPYKQPRCASRRQIIGCHKKASKGKKCTKDEMEIAGTL